MLKKLSMYINHIHLKHQIKTYFIDDLRGLSQLANTVKEFCVRHDLSTAVE